MNKLRVIFFGTSNFVVPVLKKLNKVYNVVNVVTAPDSTSGRNLKLSPSPVKETFLQLQPKKEVLTPEKITSKFAEPDFIEIIKKLKPDIIVVASYGRLIPQQVIDLPKYGSLNIHPSLLPKFRGPTPIPAAILSGERVTGITVIKMDNQMDHGPIITQEEYPVSPVDTAGGLLEGIWLRAADLLPEVIDNYIAGKIPLKAQDEKMATYCRLINKEDGYFNLSHPPSPDSLGRIVRAYYPWPNAWTIWKRKNQELRVKLLPKKLIQLEGKKPVPLENFLNGYPDFPIKSF